MKRSSPNGWPAAVIFDLDDTLIDNHYKYLAADIAALNVVFRALGTQAPEPAAILHRADALDRRMVESAGPEEKFVLERFPSAWVKTYEELSAECGLPVKEEIRRRVYAAAWRVFRPPFPMVPWAASTLEKLKGRGIALHLVTLGVDSHQRTKVARTGLAAFFQSITVAVCEKQHAMASIADRYGRHGTVMVGNSLRSDINPALRAGIHAVLIPRSTWSREREEPVSDGYHRLDDIRGLPRFLDHLGRNGSARHITAKEVRP